ncbi:MULTISPECIES: hypothetical protein [unclassified Aureispira]|uniref:hypothetical protein n=1 Tax=unclassified Aureispira TaxID=2649989 RepID=UPI0006977C4F|nr:MULTISPECIES: hypothetical protein [unclassified Aureispira]WMX16081.1 hypothetical protein QP953_06850 [Aureispira sp. CCB-E]
MKQLFLAMTVLLFANSSFAQQVFNVKDKNAIQIDIPNSNFSIQQSKTKNIVVDVEISVNYPKTVIEQLQKVNRYQLTTKSQEGTFVLEAPNLKQGVTIGGNALKETIKVTVKIPTSLTSKGNVILKGEQLKAINQTIQVNVQFVYPRKHVAATAPKTSSKLGAVQNSSKTKVPTDTKEVQALYGDIIIGNMPIDDFYD